jgi:hypothetical protein
MEKPLDSFEEVPLSEQQTSMLAQNANRDFFIINPNPILVIRKK